MRLCIVVLAVCSQPKVDAREDSRACSVSSAEASLSTLLLQHGHMVRNQFAFESMPAGKPTTSGHTIAKAITTLSIGTGDVAAKAVASKAAARETGIASIVNTTAARAAVMVTAGDTTRGSTVVTSGGLGNGELVVCISGNDCATGLVCSNHSCRSRDSMLSNAENERLNRQSSSHKLHTIRQALSRVLSVKLSLTSKLVMIPCVLIGGPLIWAWYKLDEIEHKDEIWTAQDADLREIDISGVGASGVALLRRHSDRKFGISLSIVGIMLQIVFLYYIAVFSFQHAWQPAEHKSPLPLIFCSMFCNSMACCASFIQGLKAWGTSAPIGFESIHRALVMLDSFIIPAISIMVSSIYLCTSESISSLVFSATAMVFVCCINMQIAGLMSWSLSGHGGRAFQPARVCIKDSVNTMQYAYYSLIGSALIALAMIPVAIAGYF